MARAKQRGMRRFRDWLGIYGFAVVATLVGFIVAYQYVEPAPPDEISIATGGSGGAYRAVGERLAEELAKAGVRLEVIETKGSLENLSLISGDAASVDLALVQSGLGDPERHAGVEGLASLYFEPLWLFLRADLQVETLAELRGQRIATGPEGSGTRPLALALLEINGLTAGSADLRALGSSDAAAALQAGELDAAVFVASAEAELVAGLLADPSLRLFDFERGQAYRRLFPYLETLVLPRGVLDLAADRPSQDVALISAAAGLVARQELHPALVALVLKAATEVHRAGGLFERPGQFPNGRFLDFAIDSDAERFLERGPPFLQRYLPFWAAVMVDRLAIMLLPLLTLLIPLFRIVPPLYRWRVRSRIYRWYRELEAIEETTLEGGDRAAAQTELKRIEQEVAQVEVPNSYAHEAYALRHHIDLVRQRSDRP